jgi:hypothetical protein
MPRPPRPPFGSDTGSSTAERRNWRTRARLDLLSRSGGPVRYWPVALIVALVLTGIGVWRAVRPHAAAPPVVAYSELARAVAGGAGP